MLNTSTPDPGMEYVAKKPEDAEPFREDTINPQLFESPRELLVNPNLINAEEIAATISQRGENIRKTRREDYALIA